MRRKQLYTLGKRLLNQEVSLLNGSAKQES